ncbi:phoH-like protein [Bacillus phage QCM8]|nr:phoH-like protein [Bacillus phage QCM8]UGO49131.1 PhoH-like protein [Bacillus phage vB_BanH_Emiliahah]
MAGTERLSLDKLSKQEFPLIKSLDREQQDMVAKLYKHQRVMVDSVAGSGKTTVTTQAMNALLKKGHIERLYYVVFPVQEKSLGFLPGEVSDKIKEYAVPFMQALEGANINTQYLNYEAMTDEFTNYDYKVAPHTFMRGRTFSKVGIIIDEAQNATKDELKKVLTRIDDSCYVAITGHNGQIDIAKDASGFAAYIHHFKQGVESGIYPDMGFASLTHNYRGKFSSFADQL